MAPSSSNVILSSRYQKVSSSKPEVNLEKDVIGNYYNDENTCAQMKLDIERILQAIYGIKRSDARVFFWKQQTIKSTEQPKSL